MGLGVTRLGDLSAGACGCFPTPSATASQDVFCNGRGVVRDGDKYQVHWGALPPHVPVAIALANQVFANSRLVHRTTDPLTCGDMGNQCSADTFTG